MRFRVTWFDQFGCVRAEREMLFRSRREAWDYARRAYFLIEAFSYQVEEMAA